MNLHLTGERPLQGLASRRQGRTSGAAAAIADARLRLHKARCEDVFVRAESGGSCAPHQVVRDGGEPEGEWRVRQPRDDRAATGGGAADLQSAGRCTRQDQCECHTEHFGQFGGAGSLANGFGHVSCVFVRP